MQGRLRSVALLATVLLVTTTFTGLATAETSSPLVAEAGSSRASLGVDEVLTVDGRAYGGSSPYAYLWTIDGSGEPFADPNSRRTTVDLSGFNGTVELTFRVLDATGTVATDHVLYHVAPENETLVQQNVTVGPGVPDEWIGASGAVDGETENISFEVPEEASAITATLTWQDGPNTFVITGNDLDLVLEDPSGSEATGNQGRTAGHPETVAVRSPQPGSWNATIESWLTATETANLTIRTVDAANLPNARVAGPTMFGTLDEQILHGRAQGPAGTTGAWDLDLDGVFETDGEEVTADFAPGEHKVRFKATSPSGFEDINRVTVRVTDVAEHALPLHCGGKPLRPTWSMEFGYSEGPCWMHGGHHTYVLDEPVRLLGGVGSVFSVEQQLSPPTEYEDTPTTTPVHIQTSDDAQDWSEVGAAVYRFLEDLGDGVIFDELRQGIAFEFEANRTVEYLRIHQPRSAAQGLSGFLDRSQLFLLANETSEDPSPPVSVESGTETFSCEEGEVLEDFFDDHPCWFGGVNRYDTPSFFHTYEPGEGTTVSKIEGKAQVAPWRKDDYFVPIPVPVQASIGEVDAGDREVHVDPSAELEPEEVGPFVEQLTRTKVFVQTSPDGINWTTVGNETVLFGERASFEIELEQPEPARFVRLVPDEHPRFDDFRSSPSLHHPEAYFLFSELTLTGQLPTGG